MAKTKLVIDKKNINAVLLKSPEIQDAVADVARDIAASAGSGFSVRTGKHALRVYAIVEDLSDDALQREAEQGNLSRALGAVGRRFGKYPRKTPRG
jgi:hypothetical protein